jgi:hypothetical protein
MNDPDQMELFPVEKSKITGYRDLRPEEIVLVNQIKAKELELGELWANVKLQLGVDPRALAIAKNQFQDGFMWFVRSITRPEDAF